MDNLNINLKYQKEHFIYLIKGEDHVKIVMSSCEDISSTTEAPHSNAQSLNRPLSLEEDTAH